MWGPITGVISGADGSALSNVGSGLAVYGKLGKLGYAGIAAISMPGARAVAGVAACVILLIDIFN